MRDTHLASYCEYPPEYDLVINAIKRNNPYAEKMPEKEREEFASNAVNACIRAVIYQDIGAFCCTGGCVALRASSHPTSPAYNKVLLAVRV